MSEPSVDNSSTRSAAAVIIHEPYPKPEATEFDGRDKIIFHHPGYHPLHDILFILPRLDRSSMSLQQGVHYGTALTACQIIANNAFDGYLATDREGCERVDSNLDFDHLLTKSDYWFFVPSTSPNLNPYPIVPSFRDWAFPHGSIPRWPQLEYAANSDIDHRCIVTRTAGFVKQAHLIPTAEEEWFKINAMYQYGSHGDINQKHNKIALRHDLHSAFDTHLFAIVPKNNHYVVHQLHAAEAGAMEFALAYHNYKVVLQEPEDVVPEFLFARRFCAVKDENGITAGYNIKSEWLSPTQLADQYSGGGAQSASPSKRKRNGEGNSDSSDGSDNSDTEGEWYEKNVAVLLEGDRGRSRKRRCDR
ncbi:hypothetical protein F5Y10DRAFT_271892 [Nemania abortiva]|nr:hypothetical protein F5Y10DRAFT_271892 [Nemania abortiva]